MPFNFFRKKYNFFEKSVDKYSVLWYTNQVLKIWLVGQAVKTPASHAGNAGSIPARVTKAVNKTERFYIK